jgi:hypothetical protein
MNKDDLLVAISIVTVLLALIVWGAIATVKTVDANTNARHQRIEACAKSNDVALCLRVNGH